jgi:hypothetical protein
MASVVCIGEVDDRLDNRVGEPTICGQSLYWSPMEILELGRRLCGFIDYGKLIFLSLVLEIDRKPCFDTTELIY